VASTKKLRIIIIDDDPAINMLLKTVLTKLGRSKQF
jgi:CheY-like chemotaxis protein